MNPQIMQILMQMLQNRGGGPQQNPGASSLPFPRPGMPSPMGGAAPNQMNNSIMGLLGGAPGMGAPGMGAPGMGAPGMGAPGMGAPGMGLARAPIMPRTGGVSPVASLVRNHFANQPQSPQGGSQAPMSLGNNMRQSFMDRFQR